MTVNFTTWKGITDGQTYSIPDAYLYDDWGDNKLQDRDDNETTTYNGVTGFYRPEWTVIDGSSEPSVDNEMLTIAGGDGIFHELNLNLDETITWELANVDLSDGGSTGSDNSWFYLWSEQVDNETFDRLEDSYYLDFVTDERVRMEYIDDAGNVDSLIEDSDPPAVGDYTVTRSSDGTWELLVDGDSKGTTQDTKSENPQFTGFQGRDNPDHDFDEVKVS